MDLTPPALSRSPSSPSNTYCPSERSSLDYPSPELGERQYKLSTIYAEPTCSLPTSMEPENSLPPFDTMGQPEWNGATVLHHSSATASMPGMLSAEYDAFGNYEPYGGHDVYHGHTAHAHHTPTPSPAGAASRSPGPPSRAALSYPPSVTPRVKLETASEYGQPLEVSHYPSPRSVHAPYPADNSGYASAGTGYLSDGGSSGWHKSDYQATEPDHQMYQPSGLTQDGRSPYRIQRPRRAPRRLTTKEEANFQCDVKGCGKLFSRSYNFKAHMETHDERREYPFPCPVHDCSKKFVRKTDLQRHHQSVHMKERNHKCDYCGRLFARKDTLRRHMEDGCSKRFDIGTLDLRAEGYDSLTPSARPALSAPIGHHLVNGPAGGLPPMVAIPPLGSSGMLASMAPSIRGRDLMAGGDQHHGHGWGR